MGDCRPGHRSAPTKERREPSHVQAGSVAWAAQTVGWATATVAARTVAWATLTAARASPGTARRRPGRRMRDRRPSPGRSPVWSPGSTTLYPVHTFRERSQTHAWAKPCLAGRPTALVRTQCCETNTSRGRPSGMELPDYPVVATPPTPWDQDGPALPLPAGSFPVLVTRYASRRSFPGFVARYASRQFCSCPSCSVSTGPRVW
jgi:hypothetical protein